MKTQGKGQRRPRLRVRDRLPKVRIGVSFTAMTVSLSGGSRRSVGVGGMTLTSEPVSMRKRVCVLLSLT